MPKNVATLTFAGDTKSLDHAIKKVGDESNGLKSKLGGLGSVLKGGAVAGFLALGVAAKIGFDEFAEGAKVTAQTEAVLKSTGNAARVTKGHIEDLAGSLSSMSGVDDEAIQTGQNMLLTFTNVQNRVGKGNDVFDQATKTMLDMSVAMGTDMKGGAIQLGKALNDPVKGISALSRVGVTFTEGQKASIKAMVEHGNVAGAQKVILKELQKEFGGSAEAAGKTLPGQLAKAKNALSNLAGEIVAKVVPALLSVISWVREHWPQIKAVFETVKNAVIAAVTATVNWIKTNIVPPIQSVVSTIKALWDKFGDNIINVVRTAFTSAYNVIKPLLNTIKAIIHTVLALIHGDWGEVWNGLKAIVSNALGAVVALIKGLVNNFLAAAKLLGQAIWEGIKAGLSALAGLAGKLVMGFTDALKTAASWALSSFVKVGKAVIEGIWEGIKAMGGWLKNRFEDFLKGTLLGKALSWAGILSPSKLFAKEVGVPIAQGIALGIIQSSGLVMKAIEHVLKAAARPYVPHPASTKLLEMLGLTVPRLPHEADPLSEGTLSLALAQLTPQLGDDLRALKQLEGEAWDVLQAAIKSGSAQAWLTATNNLKAARDALTALGPLQVIAGQVFATTTGESLMAPEGTAPGAGFTILAPGMAAGGIVTKPTLAMLGESGPEMVVPLSGRNGGGGNTYNITVTTLDARTAGKVVVDALNYWELRNGARYARA